MGNGSRGGGFYVSDMKSIFIRSLLRLSLPAERSAFFLLGTAERHAGKDAESNADGHAPKHLSVHLPDGHSDGNAEEHMDG